MIAALLLAGLALSSAPDETTYANEDFGLQLTLPEGWTVDERLASESSLQVVFSPAHTPTVQLTIFVRPGSPHDPLAMRALSTSAVDADPMYDNPREVELRVAGADAPGLLIDADYQGLDLLVRQAYVVEHGFPFVLQDFAPVESDDDLRRTIDAIWAGLQFTELSAAQQQRRALLELASRCGSEIHWAADWEDAVARSRAEGKPILVAARMYAGFNISDERMTGDFMDEDTVAILNERYVPLDVGKADVDSLPFSAPERYGLGPHTFGQATLVVTPDGRVLAEANPLTDEFLRASADLDPSLPGARVPGLDAFDERLELAELRYRRGELDAVLELLAEPVTAAEYWLLMQTHVRLRDGPKAVAALGAAREAPGADALTNDLDVDEAELRVLFGDNIQSVELLELILMDFPGHPRVPEVLLSRGVMALAQGDKQDAEGWLRRLVADHPDSRWAWLAAGLLTSTSWSRAVPFRLSWPSAELQASLDQPRYELVPVDQAPRAAEEALQYLLRNQQADGSWIALGEIGRTDAQPPSHFDLAVTSICSQGLLPHRSQRDVAIALDRSLDWLLNGYARSVAVGEPAYFLDYTCWSRAYMLDFLAAASAAGLEEPSRLAVPVQSLLDELAGLQKPGGGWSYYVTGDLGNPDNPTYFAMSFTTAAVVLSLQRAREAGFDVPDRLIQGGLDTLERARLGDVYTYMVQPPGAPVNEPLRRAGSAGRGPVCALALYRDGHADLEELRSALDVFVELRGGLASELGKNLMHTGREAQGSHYLMFDYRYAAAAVGALPADDRGAYQQPVLEELLRCRTVEGAYVDNPLNSRALGAGMALLAFQDLGVDG